MTSRFAGPLLLVIAAFGLSGTACGSLSGDTGAEATREIEVTYEIPDLFIGENFIVRARGSRVTGQKSRYVVSRLNDSQGRGVSADTCEEAQAMAKESAARHGHENEEECKERTIDLTETMEVRAEDSTGSAMLSILDDPSISYLIQVFHDKPDDGTDYFCEVGSAELNPDQMRVDFQVSDDFACTGD